MPTTKKEPESLSLVKSSKWPQVLNETSKMAVWQEGLELIKDLPFLAGPMLGNKHIGQVEKQKLLNWLWLKVNLTPPHAWSLAVKIWGHEEETIRELWKLGVAWQHSILQEGVCPLDLAEAVLASEDVMVPYSAASLVTLVLERGPFSAERLSEILWQTKDRRWINSLLNNKNLPKAAVRSKLRRDGPVTAHVLKNHLGTYDLPSLDIRTLGWLAKKETMAQLLEWMGGKAAWSDSQARLIVREILRLGEQENVYPQDEHDERFTGLWLKLIGKNPKVVWSETRRLGIFLCRRSPVFMVKWIEEYAGPGSIAWEALGKNFLAVLLGHSDKDVRVLAAGIGARIKTEKTQKSGQAITKSIGK